MWSHFRISVAPWQSIPEQMAKLGLTERDGITQAWFVDDNGLSGGAAAINGALRFIWWARPFATLYHVPGIKQFEHAVYQWVATNRHRLPGGTQACEKETTNEAN